MDLVVAGGTRVPRSVSAEHRHHREVVSNVDRLTAQVAAWIGSSPLGEIPEQGRV